MYDYLIVGSGLFGATFANYANSKGKSCLIIEKRSHSGGNVYCESVEGINVHKYGPHIFHTNSKEIWDFVNSHVEFNRFTYSPVANYKGEIYNLPFNMNTFNRLWGTTTPDEAKKVIETQRNAFGIKNPKNLEEQAISLVGIDIYTKLIKGYTEKQWGRKATDLPPFIIKRLPVRFTYDNNYFNDKYQGIPIGGYNNLIESLIDGVEIKLNTNFFENKEYFEGISKKIIYTGPIDTFFNYKFGQLEYRSLKFENEFFENLSNYQGNAGVNYTDFDVPYSRIIEHKHFEFGKQNHTIITKEYPVEWKLGKEQYYPVNDLKNNSLYKMYTDNFESQGLDKKYIFGGRLAEYKYYDMHQIIASSLKKAKNEIK
jgi:UDP-galactopyranose mutase